MYTSRIFDDIIRPCPECSVPYDDRLHTPHVLACSHTFCLMCLTKQDQRKKRHCPKCDAKYSKIVPNLALIEACKRLEERQMFFETETRQCDDCGNRAPRNMLRQCDTCEKQFVSRTEYRLECIICLECCVDSHSGHELCRLPPSSAPTLPPSPMVKSRQRHPSTSSAMSLQYRSTGKIAAKTIIETIRSWTCKPAATPLTFLLKKSKMAFSEEEIVMQTASPIFSREDLRMIGCSGSNPDTISMDSVFESPTRSSFFTNNNSDSGVLFSTPPMPHRISSSTSSLRMPPSPSSSSCHSIQECFATTRGSRNNRIRMGVTDIVNTPRRPMPLYTSTPNQPTMKTTRSENSVSPPTPSKPFY